MVTLVDSSVWIEFLRGTGSRADAFLQEHLGNDVLAVTEPIQMEVLAGSPPSTVEATTRLLDSQQLVGAQPAEDYLAAARLFQACRRHGHTIRSLNDCLIAAVALRAGTTLVHRDADFEVLAEITDLDSVSLR